MKSNYTKTMIALATTHWMGDCYGAAWPIFKYMVGLDLERAGLIITIATMIGAGTQPLFGMLSDQGYRRKLILWGTCLSGVGMLLGPASLLSSSLDVNTYYGVLLLIMMTQAFGAGVYHPAGTSAAGDISPARRTTCVSVFIACGMFGMACSHGFFSYCFRVLHGHTEWLLILPVVLFFVAHAWCHPGQINVASSSTSRWRQLGNVRRPMILLFCFQVAMGGMYHGFAFLMPEFFEIRYCPGWMIRGGAYLFYVTGSSAMMLLGGPLADRFGRHRLLLLFTAAAVGMLYLVILLPGATWGVYIILLMLAGGFGGAINPMVVSIGQRLAPECASTVSGILMGLAWAAASPSFWLIGILAKRLGIVEALLWVGSLGSVGLLAVLILVFQRKR